MNKAVCKAETEWLDNLDIRAIQRQTFFQFLIRIILQINLDVFGLIISRLNRYEKLCKFDSIEIFLIFVTQLFQRYLVLTKSY